MSASTSRFSLPGTPSPFHRRPARWLALVPLALALASGCSREAAPVANAQDDPMSDAVSAAAPAEAAFDSRLSIVDNNGMLRFDGTVDSDAARKTITEAIGAAYASDRVSGGVTVDGNARPAPWLHGLAPFLAGFKAPGAAISFRADTIELSGQVAADQRGRLETLARTHFPGLRLSGLFAGQDGDADPAIAALAALHPQSPAHGVESALNKMAIGFEQGSAKIAPASLAVIAQAGQTLASMPADRRVEIAGHAAASGDPDADALLSRRRAEAVKVQLIVNGVNPGMIETLASDGGAATGTQADQVTFRVLN
ncbi:OmpA family protein [Lysobacter maris]|uniref:OmpA family protein n=1 Tax=Marilutibacter maris TaxID=1605891 RepID=A0A508ATZ3_9GAMM|nr:OmpA family protein [Lysobacter maris]KAB8193354.1 OmpA family protein [Lysobacter maris]